MKRKLIGENDMPYSPQKPCRSPGCPELTDKRFCIKHQREYSRSRGSATAQGYDIRWQAVRKRFLNLNPLCAECLKQGRPVPATEVHHIIPLRDGGTHEFDNFMALCKQCHSKITNKQQREYRY